MMDRAQYMREYRKSRKDSGTPGDTRKRSRSEYMAQYRTGRVNPPGAKAKSKWDRRRIVAWDGEGCEIGGVHTYVLLANSEGVSLMDKTGLSTERILYTMTDPKLKYHLSINVFYGMGYDINMILGDLPRKYVADLWEFGSVRWKQFEIRYRPHKMFTVRRLSFGNKDSKVSTFYDVLGFSQGSFVKALEKWGVGNPQEIADMKARRGTFRISQLPKIIAYNAKELEYLKAIHEKTCEAHDKLGLRLDNHFGAGSSAGALLQTKSVKNFLPPPNSARPILEIQKAYFGGRIELIQYGRSNSKIYSYDINSAYPHFTTDLPCLSHGKWEYTPGDEPIWLSSPFSVSNVHWDCPDYEHRFYPFPYREVDGSIIFPSQGKGWYWSPEVESCPSKYREIYGTWSWEQTCQGHHPFSFIPEIYLQRKEYEQQGKTGEALVLKLAMNSIYGKLAQQLGGVEGRPPAYHCLEWAGFITSKTRAAMYELAGKYEDKVISFATDGVLLTTPARGVDIGDGLGQWSKEVYEGGLFVQPGVYFLGGDDGHWESKFRGFNPGSLDTEKILTGWKTKSKVPVPTTRFIGLGSALVSDKWWEKWRSWDKSIRHLDLFPHGKRTGPKTSSYARKLVASQAKLNLTPEVDSEPFEILWEGGIDRSGEVEGVPTRIVEAEELDSYN